MKSIHRLLCATLAFFLTSGSSPVSAQVPTKMWDVRFGGSKFDVPDGIIETPDNGIMIAGVSASNNDGNKSQISQGLYDFWVVKTDANGNMQWDKRFGGTDDDGAYDIQQTGDGNYLISGYSASPANGDKSENTRGNKDFWAIKISPDGNKIWDHCYGGNKGEVLRGALPASDGGFLLAGYSFSGISGDKTQPKNGPEGTADYWIIKIDAHGVKQWDRSFGGDGEDELTALAPASHGGYLLAGSSASSHSGDHTQPSQGMNDFWIIKIDSLGNKLWDLRYGGSNDDFLIELTKSNDGGYLLGGYSFSEIGGDKSQDCLGQSDVWMVKIDSNGVKQWDVRFGASKMDRSRSVIQTLDGGYFIGGYTNSLQEGDISEQSRGVYDSWVIKLDANGAKQWEKRYGGDADDYCHLVTQYSDGDYILVGHSQSGVSGDKSQTCFGSDDYWMLKLELIVSLPIGLSQFEAYPQNSGAILDWTTLSENSNNYFAIQRSPDAKTFDSIGMVPGAGTSSAAHDYSYFDENPPLQTVYYRLKQVDHDGGYAFSDIKAVKLQSGLSCQSVCCSVYPNPASHYMIIEFAEVLNGEGVLEMYNASGQLVFTSAIPLTSLKQQIDIWQLAAGIYSVRIKSPGRISAFHKILINK